MPKAYTPNDKWSRKAKEEGYRARSFYKLKELDEKFNLTRSGLKVLDLGAAPGSWLQYTSKKVGKDGKVLGLDLEKIFPVAENVKTVVCDITNLEEVEEIIRNLSFENLDLILSDISPNTSGIKYVDQQRSIQLNQIIFKIAQKYLKSGGVLVMKVFHGESLFSFRKELERYFPKVIVTKTKVSRERSKEVYLICFN